MPSETPKAKAHDLVVQNGTVVTVTDGQFRADVAATDGTISAISAPGTLSGDRVVDAKGKYVLPGAIDPHTHHGIARDLADDTESESRSGLVGGVTTIGNMVITPNRDRPWTETVPEFVDAIESNALADIFLILAPLNRTHIEEIPGVIENHGITEFKWFNNLKQSDELTEDIADEFLEVLASREEPTALGYHSENTEITSVRRNRLESEGADGYEALVEAFPGYAEAQSTLSGAGLAYQHDYDDQFYVVHVSAAETVEELQRLQETGYEMWAETCPHYLTLTTEQCDDLMKINPPVRGNDDRDALWGALADGTISCIGSDHCVKPDKVGETIWETENAFPGSATMLPLLLSEGVNEGRLSLECVVAVTSTNNAKAWNLYPKKGTVRIGSDADLAIVDLNETRTVTPELLQSACEYTIYDGMEVTGWPTHTIVRGEVVYDEGTITGEPGYGTHIDRPV